MFINIVWGNKKKKKDVSIKMQFNPGPAISRIRNTSLECPFQTFKYNSLSGSCFLDASHLTT